MMRRKRRRRDGGKEGGKEGRRGGNDSRQFLDCFGSEQRWPLFIISSFYFIISSKQTDTQTDNYIDSQGSLSSVFNPE